MTKDPPLTEPAPDGLDEVISNTVAEQMAWFKENGGVWIAHEALSGSVSYNINWDSVEKLIEDIYREINGLLTR